jgi:IS1 family transposase/transposase-like protein
LSANPHPEEAEMTPIAPDQGMDTRLSCPNPDCALFNQTGHGNISHRSWTGKRKDIERLRCRVCGREFSEREGTLMAYTKLPQKKVIRLTKCQRWGVCDEGTADICEVDIKTVHRFQRVSFGRAQEHQHQAARDVDVKGVQLDEAHSKRRPGQVEWIHTAIAMGSLFILWVAFGPRNTDTAAYLIAQVIARLKEVPLFLTDGWQVYPAALIQVIGQVYHPRRKGKVGRFPKPRLVAPQNLFYAQVIKVRDQAGRVVGVTTEVVFGGPRRFFKHLRQKGLGTTIQTAFMERWYATLRGWVAALRRRTRCLSWSRERHQGRVWLMVNLYNYVIPPKSLRQGRIKRTPAMAIGLTDHIWSYSEYIWLPVHPDPLLKKQMEERIEQLLTPALSDTFKAEVSTNTCSARTKKKRAGPLKKVA